MAKKTNKNCSDNPKGNTISVNHNQSDNHGTEHEREPSIEELKKFYYEQKELSSSRRTSTPNASVISASQTSDDNRGFLGFKSPTTQKEVEHSDRESSSSSSNEDSDDDENQSSDEEQENGQQNNNFSDKDNSIPPSGTVHKNAEDLSSQIYASSAREEGVQKSTATTEGQNKDAVDTGKPLNLYFCEFCHFH